MPPRVQKLAAAAALVVTVGLAVTWASRRLAGGATTVRRLRFSAQESGCCLA
jgi:hypothetical protein